MCCIFMSQHISTSATESEDLTNYILGTTDLQLAHVTAYTDCGYTKSGQYIREGICAGKEEWLGCVAVIYQRMPDGSIGECLGMYEILDTGGTEGLKNGSVIDVWQPTQHQCDEFIDKSYENGCEGKIYLQIIKGEG